MAREMADWAVPPPFLHIYILINDHIHTNEFHHTNGEPNTLMEPGGCSNIPKTTATAPFLIMFNHIKSHLDKF